MKKIATFVALVFAWAGGKRTLKNQPFVGLKTDGVSASTLYLSNFPYLFDIFSKLNTYLNYNEKILDQPKNLTDKSKLGVETYEDMMGFCMVALQQGFIQSELDHLFANYALLTISSDELVEVFGLRTPWVGLLRDLSSDDPRLVKAQAAVTQIRDEAQNLLPRFVFALQGMRNPAFFWRIQLGVETRDSIFKAQDDSIAVVDTGLDIETKIAEGAVKFDSLFDDFSSGLDLLESIRQRLAESIVGGSVQLIPVALAASVAFLY